MKKLSKLNEAQETYDNFLNLPPVDALGDGRHEGALWGHCFACEGCKYWSETGLRNIYPMKVAMTVENGKCLPGFEELDKYQHPELKELFEKPNCPQGGSLQ